MPTRRRSVDPTPDLFASVPPPPTRPERPLAQGNKAEADDSGSRPKPLLPKDLAGALQRLTDAEVDSLLAAVTAEAKHRGRLPPAPQREKPTAKTRLRPRWASADRGTGSLTTGKLNAVRAAFKAGVKPSAIARQFGISKADVRKAIATAGASQNELKIDG